MALIRLIKCLLLSLLLLSGCAVTALPPAVENTPGATLHLYLEPAPQNAHLLSLTISSLNARRADGLDIPLLTEDWAFNPIDNVGRQTKLLQRKLPFGEYTGLALTVSSATLLTEDKPVDLLIDNQPQLLDVKFSISPQQAETLFLSLNPERLVTGGYKLTAQFSTWKAQAPLSDLKGIVSHPNDGLLTIFEKKTPTIVSVTAVGKRPTGIALNQTDRQAYLALQGENSIALFDLVRDQVQKKIRLHSAARPTKLELTGDNRLLIALNSGSNSLSIIDTASGIEKRQILFSSPAEAVFVAENQHRAYVTLPDINGLASVDLDRGVVSNTATLTDTGTRGVADRVGRQIYLLTENTPDLLVVDANSLAITNRVHIGYGASCLALNRNNGLIYVGMQSGQVAVIDPQVGLPIDSFSAPPKVVGLIPELEENSLFVISRQGNVLSKYDLVSKKQVAVLELGADSFDLAVMGEM